MSLYSQRDIVVIDSIQSIKNTSIWNPKTYKLTFILKDTSYISFNRNDLKWSDNMGDYIFYSRIEMGRRMNYGIDYNKKSNQYFKYGTISLGTASVFYILAAYNNPVSYIESNSKYTRDYFNTAKLSRNIKVSTGVLFTITSIYFYYKSYDYSNKSRWMISPDGIRYKF